MVGYGRGPHNTAKVRRPHGITESGVGSARAEEHARQPRFPIHLGHRAVVRLARRR
jgi:hypothetical protein